MPAIYTEFTLYRPYFWDALQSLKKWGFSQIPISVFNGEKTTEEKVDFTSDFTCSIDQQTYTMTIEEGKNRGDCRIKLNPTS